MTSAQMHPETLDHTYKLLSNARRRQLLYLLVEPGQWTVDTLARRLTAWEQDTPAPAVTETQKSQVKATLVHNHLPRLADHDTIEYDADKETVAPGERFNDVRSFIDHARALEFGGESTTQPVAGEVTD
ncbi:hypothetical protein G6M89_11725 [Natronolimnobius sp. AArcel1]|uniref:DUF7344 domain-containing protein n=1 Tax=Natronolimnobius sp. AArcel1 TaxID=1679093 RepID=UPI0013EA6264|nr:hypothetical protein [Natronolimnobius sp. AArcel1]NGM69667.1 hypothetical protein [Natronolimnobius sp. AArcel1]